MHKLLITDMISYKGELRTLGIHGIHSFSSYEHHGLMCFLRIVIVKNVFCDFDVFGEGWLVSLEVKLRLPVLPRLIF